MLRRRLIPCLFLQNGLIVRSESFREFKQLGNPIAQLQRLNEWDADELIYVDITRTGGYDLKRDDLVVKARHDVIDILRDVSKHAFMPLTFGGRIRSLDTVDAFIANGADKVIINTGAYLDPDLVRAVAYRYGAQAMVAGLDIRREADGWGVYIGNGTTRVAETLTERIRQLVSQGAGEIFLNSIDRDGTASGYDIEAIKVACAAAEVPVVACGGAATFEDFAEVLERTDASAVAAGNIFNFTENAYLRAKRTLRDLGFAVR